MNDCTEPLKDIKCGDKIEHDLMPGFAMKVQAMRPCKTDGVRVQVHEAYEITDPEGNTDWLCAYDVHRA